MQQPKILPIIFLLSPLVFSFAFALDIYIPAIPIMKEVLHTTQAEVQLTLSIFMLVSGLGQLVLGPAADQYGRRRLILGCIILFTLGSLWCTFATSINFFLIGRIFQAFGGCGMTVGSFAIVRDLFSGKESAKVYSFLNCGLGLSPLFAPIIGSYLLEWFGWRAGFIFLFIMGLIILTVSFFKIKETLVPENSKSMDWKIFTRYWNILIHPVFMTYIFCASSGMMIFFVFFSSSPYIVMNLLHAPAKDFGYYFFVVGASFFIGSLLSGKIAERIGVFQTVLIGTVLMLLGGILMIVWYKISGVSTAEFLLPCIIAGIGGSFMLGAGMAGAMEPFAETAGSAAALAGCLQFLSSAVLGSIILHWPVHSTMPLAGTMTGLSILSLAVIGVYWLGRLKQLKTR